MRDAVIGLIGLPRSGTTLIHRAMAAHSRADGVIEPYQAGRAQGYCTTDLSRFLVDHRIAPDADRALIVKETTTRSANVQHLFELLASAQLLGVYVGLVLILRCPFEAYLSQIEASRRLWKEKKLISHSVSTFKTFVDVSRKSSDGGNGPSPTAAFQNRLIRGVLSEAGDGAGALDGTHPLSPRIRAIDALLRAKRASRWRSEDL